MLRIYQKSSQLRKINFNRNTKTTVVIDVTIRSLALGLSCGMRYHVTSDISLRIDPTLRKLLFDILNSGRWLYWYAHFNKKGKISQKCRKINSCLFVSTFKIFYLYNSFFFILLSSSYPYYHFYFIYLSTVIFSF